MKMSRLPESLACGHIPPSDIQSDRCLSMYRPGHILAVLAMVSCAWLDAAAAAGADTLTGKEIKAEIIGRSFHYKGRMGTGITHYGRDGTVSFEDKRWGKDSGPWWIEGNKWCRTYRRYRHTRCMTFERLGDGRYRSSSGFVYTPAN